MRSKNSIACWIKHFECFQVIFLKNIIIKWNYAFISLIFHERIVQAFLCIMCYWRLVKHIEYSAIMGLWCTMVILLEAMFSFEFFLIEINPLYPHLSLDSFYFYWCWVTVAVWAFSSCHEQRYSSWQCVDFSLWWLLLLWNMGSWVHGLQ